MKLNPDCIRDILLHCEEHCRDEKGIRFAGNDVVVNNTAYPRNILWYHLRQCNLSGYLYCAKQKRNYYIVKDITPIAHELLENIRNESNWDKVKENAVKVGLFALNVINNFSPASKVVSPAIGIIKSIGKKDD